MKATRELAALCLVFLIAFSFVSLLERQKETASAFAPSSKTMLNIRFPTLKTAIDSTILSSFQSTLLALPAFTNVQNTLEKAPLPENTSRTAIYNCIDTNPGIQFRAICSGLGLSIGVVQFHRIQLQKAGLIGSIRKGKYLRFFVAHKFSRLEMETIATLKLNTVKSILKTLLDGKEATHGQIAAQLNISSQGLTWQMHRLKETGLVQQNKSGLTITYSINALYVLVVSKSIALLDKT
jgi:predicted transcriptional regulator